MWPRDVDVTAPRSRHSLHVTARSDLEGVGPWSVADLYAAVRFADDGDDRVAVLDYGRTSIYVAAATDLRYDPPRGLGFAAPPALHVADPRLFDPAEGTATPVDPVAVSPEFDVLVPAFDWEDLDEGDLLPPTHVRESSAPAGSGAGTPG